LKRPYKNININDIVSGPDLVKLQSLSKIIKNNECIAFVGAGLSKAENYKDWEESIKGKNGLIEYVFSGGNNYLLDPTKKIIDIIEDCKKHNINKYREFILNEYGRGLSPLVFHPNHQQIWKIPFYCVLTTNFDPCLYDSGRYSKSINIFSYPYLPSPPLKNSLYHIHGLAFEIDDDIDPINTIIFSKSEYDNAYKVRRNDLTDLLHYSMTKYTMLFVGFSMSDPFILDLFKDIYKNIKSRIEEFKIKLNMEVKIPHHFILFPEGEPNEELLKDLTALKISVINYKPIDAKYVGLDHILLYLVQGVQESFIPTPSIKDSSELGAIDEN